MPPRWARLLPFAQGFRAIMAPTMTTPITSVENVGISSVMPPAAKMSRSYQCMLRKTRPFRAAAMAKMNREVIITSTAGAKPVHQQHGRVHGKCTAR